MNNVMEIGQRTQKKGKMLRKSSHDSQKRRKKAKPKKG